MPDVSALSFDDFVAKACEPPSTGALRRLRDSAIALISARCRARLVREVEQARAWPTRVDELRAICAAMTSQERNDPILVDYAARQRIAAEAGVDAMAVSQLIRNYLSYRRAMSQLAKVEQ
jgi:signal recognition particle GTPase